MISSATCDESPDLNSSHNKPCVFQVILRPFAGIICWHATSDRLSTALTVLGRPAAIHEGPSFVTLTLAGERECD